MNDVDKNRTVEIKKLHSEFIESFKKTLDCGVRIGDLLKQQKDGLKHGEFGKWISENLPFSIRTAQNYMKLYKERDRLKNATVSHLTEGYKLLSEPKPLEGWEKICHCYANCVNIIKEELKCSWKTAFNKIAKGTGFPLNVLLNWYCHFFGVVSDDLIPEPISKEENEQTVDVIIEIYERRKKWKRNLICD